MNQELGDLVSCEKWGRRHGNLNCLSLLTLCHKRDACSLGSRNGVGGKDALQAVWFWGKFSYFPAAVFAHSRDDIVPLHRRMAQLASGCSTKTTPTGGVTFFKVQQTFSSKSVTSLIQS